jgi:hypothetical protein
MKKSYILITLLFLLVSLSASAKFVEIKEAKLAGKNYYYSRLTNNLNRIIPYASVTITGEFIEREEGIPAYYVFNFSGNGFIIVSAEDACYPVLGYSFESPWMPDNLPQNLTNWLYNYKYEINSVRRGNLQPDEQIRNSWKQILVTDPSMLDNSMVTTDVLPLINSMWNQDFPYNGLCPKDAASGGSYSGRVPVGCVATAMSQIMHYWRYPAQGQGSHCITPLQTVYGQQCANFGSTTYDWNGMPDQANLESNALATLAWHCGIGVDMQYDPSGSGSNLGKASSAFRNYFKYANTTQYQNRNPNYTTWVNLLKADVDAAQPVEYAGDDNSAGHAFVLDGYQQVGTDYMFHFNWGLGGSANGYYYLNNLNPNGSNFNYHQGAVVHIAPDPGYYPTFCSGTVNITTNFGSIEDGSGPVADYLSFSNCGWLIAPDDSVKNITLSFSRFNTAAGDIVNVYDGANASAPLIGSYSGALSTMPSVTSTGPQMFITFTTDGTTTAPGWRADFTTSLYKFCESTTTLLGGWGNITDGSGRFDYRNLSNCKWIIKPQGATKLFITVNSFNTEPVVDKLLIYDLGTSALLATLSGNYTTLPAPIYSTTGSMMLMWQSNNAIRGAGWDINYSVMVGTDKPDPIMDLSVFPNPANDYVGLSFTIDAPQDIKTELMTITGEIIFSDNVPNFRGTYQKNLDVSALAKGLYLLRVTSGQGTLVRKIAVQ